MSINDPQSLAYDLANSPFNGLVSLHKHAEFVKPEHSKLFLDLVNNTDACPNDQFEYLLAEDISAEHLDSLRREQKAHKAKVAKLLAEAAKAKFNALDIATTWDPLRGVSIQGVLFRVQPNDRDPDWLQHALDAEQALKTYAGWRRIDNYDEGGHAWLAVPDKRTKLGRAAEEELDKLRDQYKGVLEFNDWLSEHFDCFGELGQYVDNGVVRATVARFFDLALGLFVKLPRIRSFELSDIWVSVSRTAFTYAEEMEEHYAAASKEKQDA